MAEKGGGGAGGRALQGCVTCIAEEMEVILLTTIAVLRVVLERMTCMCSLCMITRLRPIYNGDVGMYGG